MRLRPVAPLLVLALAGSLMTSCNIVGAAGVLISGPPKVPAATSLDKTRPTVLLIDDLNTILPRASLRDRIGRTAESEILSKKVVEDGQLVSSSSIRRAVSGDTNEARTSVVDAGRAVRAEVVIHVSILGWTMTSTPGEVSPMAVIGVKIVDTLANERQWPEGEGMFTTRVELPVRADRTLESNADRRRVEDALADRIGMSLAKLFYTSERERISQQRELN